jgi:hypothetical protein
LNFSRNAPSTGIFGDAEHLEHAEDVGSELDSGADLLELRRLLEQRAGNALLRQRQRRRQAADAAADNDNGRSF